MQDSYPRSLSRASISILSPRVELGRTMRETEQTSIKNDFNQERIQTEDEGGQLGEGAPKTQWKVSAPKAREHFWGVIRENSLVFLLNNALAYMLPRIQNETMKKECIWVRIRGTASRQKEGTKAEFSS